MSKYIITILFAIITLGLNGCNKVSDKELKAAVLKAESCYADAMADFAKDQQKQGTGSGMGANFEQRNEFRQQCGLPLEKEDSEFDDREVSPDKETPPAPKSAPAPVPAKELKAGIKIRMDQKQVPFGGAVITTNYVVVIAVDNNVSIESITINRGNCKVIPAIKLFSQPVNGSWEEKFAWPYKMKFGEEREFIVRECSNVIEVDITQDGNTWQFQPK